MSRQVIFISSILSIFLEKLLAIIMYSSTRLFVPHLTYFAFCIKSFATFSALTASCHFTSQKRISFFVMLLMPTTSISKEDLSLSVIYFNGILPHTLPNKLYLFLVGISELINSSLTKSSNFKPKYEFKSTL